MFNTRLLSGRNLLVISLMAIVIHIAAKPLYNMVDTSPNDDGAN